MRWDKATDEQIWNIIANDWYVPEHLLEGMVTEALRRNLFNPLIKHLINKYFNRWGTERLYNYYDLYQMGYVGIALALKYYKVGKGSFKTFSYMQIKGVFLQHREKIQAAKRKVYEGMLSLDGQKHDENEESFIESLVDEKQNPEKVTINKMFWAENFSKLSQREREVLIYFAEGYTMREIADIYGINGVASIHRQLHRGIKKINPNAEKVNLKELGLTNVSVKGA